MNNTKNSNEDSMENMKPSERLTEYKRIFQLAIDKAIAENERLGLGENRKKIVYPEVEPQAETVADEPDTSDTDSHRD